MYVVDALHVIYVFVQREDAARDTLADSRGEPTASDTANLPASNANTKAEPGNKHKRILRTYGQKKVKADSSADTAAATLSSDFLALVGGQR